MRDESKTQESELLEVSGFNSEFCQLPAAVMELVKFDVEKSEESGATELAFLARKARKYLDLLLDRAIEYCENESTRS